VGIPAQQATPELIVDDRTDEELVIGYERRPEPGDDMLICPEDMLIVLLSRE
jgi:hypothetical protein